MRRNALQFETTRVRTKYASYANQRASVHSKRSAMQFTAKMSNDLQRAALRNDGKQCGPSNAMKKRSCWQWPNIRKPAHSKDQALVREGVRVQCHAMPCNAQ
eukprot:9484321-Pyramimonas_sp.AAC.1